MEREGWDVAFCEAAVDDLLHHSIKNAELLIVLGGPIGAYETDDYPFLTAEISLIEYRLSRDLPTVGICLGSQLMARALGARVFKGRIKEIGWGTVDLTDAGRSSCLKALHGDDAVVLHWHGDTFSLPKGALRLASTAITENQAFEFGPTALAIQFHPEAEPEGFERWLIGHACEVAAAGVSVSELRSSMRQFGVSSALRGRACLTQWLARLYSSPGSAPKNRQDLQASHSNP